MWLLLMKIYYRIYARYCRLLTVDYVDGGHGIQNQDTAGYTADYTAGYSETGLHGVFDIYLTLLSCIIMECI